MKLNLFNRFLALLCIMVLHSSGICLAQLSQVVSGASMYSPPSPNASALLRYANVPVDEHTGVASVVLPIDQLAGRQLSVPITLSYHGSGNKVQDIASNVGLGFVLNAGGVITRVMRGLPDESPHGYQYFGKKVYSGDIDSVYLNATINNKKDAEPDMFYFNFLGHAGKMVIDTLGNPQYLPDQGIRVISHPITNDIEAVQSPWILKDLNGTTYIFGADTTSQEITKVNVNGRPDTSAIKYISSWYLAKVISADGKEAVNFNYTTGADLSYTQYRYITTYSIQHDITDTRTGIFSSHIRHTDVPSLHDVNKIDVSTIISVLNPKYLSSIANDMGSVSFSYTSRSDLSGGQALDQVKIYDIDDSSTPLKTYTFNESYFVSPHPNSPIDPDSKRLRLDAVNLQGRSAEVKQLFAFSYNEQNLLPPRNSDEFDHWGYYTTLDERGGFPSINLTLDQLNNYDDGFDRRVPDSTRVQANMLNRIRNVNGGYTSFSYGIDEYKYNGDVYIGGGVRIRTIVESDSLGQVIPIIKQYTYLMDDGTTSGMVYNPKPYYIQGITNYDDPSTVVPSLPSLLNYEASTFKNPFTIVGTVAEVALSWSNPVGIAIDIGITILAPAIVDAWDFFFHKTHRYTSYTPPFSYSSTPLNNLFDVNGASVTYSQVEVTNSDKGKTVNYYTSQQEYPDSTSSATLNCLAQPVKAIYGNTGSYSPATSFDFERGLLKMSKAYDSNNNLVSMTINTYQLSPRVSAVNGQRSSVSGYAALLDGSFKAITYSVGVYKEISENIQLAQSVTQLFDQTNNGASITTTHNYTWQPVYPTLMHSESTPRSDGNLLVNYTTYPMEYASGTPFLDSMVRHNMVAVPIEQVSTLVSQTSRLHTPAGVSIIGGMVKRFKTGGTGLLDTVFAIRASDPIPLDSFKFSNQLIGTMGGSYQNYVIDKSYTPKAFYQAYDSKNNLSQSQNVGEPSSSVIWGYNQDVPIATISNATLDKVAYTSFETNDQRYWSFTSGGRDSSGLAKTGKVRYQLSSGAITTTNTIPAGTYLISLWTQGSKPTIGGTSADVSIVNGESDNHSWNYYMDRITVTGGSSISLTGSGLVDEVRLYPQGAHLSSVTIKPQVGTTSTNSPDDKVNTYQYDELQRIKTERDDQYNILKQYNYSVVPAIAYSNTPDPWIGISPVCYTDQTSIVPDTTQYSATATNNLGTLVCSFNRAPTESSYMANINYTVWFSDKTTYSNSILIKQGTLSTSIGLPLGGKSASSVMHIGIDTVINFSNTYGVTYQSFPSRQRVRDSYTEANTLTGGLGPYIAPIRSSAGCSNLFSNTVQTGFVKNDCVSGGGSIVDYTIAPGTYTSTSQYKADSIARAAGQVYANANGNCTQVDTVFAGINPVCIAGSADPGTPSLTDYSMAISYTPQVYMLNATITRDSVTALHDATVTYGILFNDGSTVSYTVPMYKNHRSVTISPPLAGYGPNDVLSVTMTGVVYSALARTAYTDRKRILNGVEDGYTEANTVGRYYLAPIEDPGACGTWFYNTAQTGFYKNNCPSGAPGSPVSYTVAAHTDSSTVSQTYADALARVRGQAYANDNGSCYTATPYVTTYAGDGQQGYRDGASLSAEFDGFNFIATDSNNNLYVSDSFWNSMIRKISANGTVSTLAGSPSTGYVDSTGTAARFLTIYGLAVDALGNVYVGESGNNKIRKITQAGVVTTLAGSTLGYADGLGSAAKFSFPYGMGIDPFGNLVINDVGNYRVRQITPAGLVTTFAGNGTNGYTDGPVNTAEFSSLQSITVDKLGNTYLFDSGRIRKISGGNVSTLAGDGTIGYLDGTGTGVKFGESIPQMITDASGNLYVCDFDNNCVRKITPAGVVTTLTTNRTPGYVNGPVSSAQFNSPTGITIDASGNIYVSDYANYVIRKITFP